MNFKYALRSVRKSPLVMVVAILSLALGIGANTAIFSLIDQLLLKTLPVQNPEELVQLATEGRHYGSQWGGNLLSYPMYRDIRDRNTVFSGVLAYRAAPISLGYGGRTERIRSELVTGDYFEVLGIRPAMGRVFNRDDNDTVGAEPVAVLTYDAWISRFGGDRNVVGSTIHLNGLPMTIIGVSGRGFHGIEIGDATEVFVPMLMQRQIDPVLGQFATLEDRRSQWVNVFARRRSGITIEQAGAALAPIYRQIIEMEVLEPGFAKASAENRQAFLESRLAVFDGSTGRSGLRLRFTTPLYVLMATTGLVLLIACANVAGLLIARGTARQKEIAVRLAIGASRAQIVGQLMAESLLLSAASAIAGLGIGFWIDRMLLKFLPADNAQITLTAALDGRGLAFSVVVAFVTAFLFGLVPALQCTRPRLSETLKNEAASVFGGHGQARARKALVVAQVGLSLLLLITSSLFVRSLGNLQQLDPGFSTGSVISFSIDPRLNGYDLKRTALFYRNMQERLKALPGVESVGHSVIRLIDGNMWRNSLTVEGYTSQSDDRVNAYYNAVSTSYFETLDIPLLAGRNFSSRDASGGPPVVIVNQAFARKYFPDGAAVGRHVGRGSDPGTRTDIEIIGIVGDAKYENMRDDAPRQVFIPFSEVEAGTGATVYVRTAQNAAAYSEILRSAIREIDPNMPVYALRTMEEQVDRNLTTERMIATLASGFGILATLLAMIGLYGLMSATVASRYREIGIRVALGAQASNVIWMMMREVVILMFTGIAIALPAYIAVTSYIRSQLYGIEPGDPVNIAGAALVLLVVGLVAGYIPSRRALQVDPIRTLKYE